MYEQKGYQVEIEAKRVGGRVDVLAIKGDERIGIEIETGKSDVVANVKNYLRSYFDHVFLIATDQVAYRKIQSSLVKSDLLIPQRVSLQIV